MIFFDTSAAAKLYVAEQESTVVRQLVEAEDQVVLCELARPEIMAVFHRRLREKKWTQADFSFAVRQFSRDDISGFWTWLPLDRAIFNAAAEIYTTLPETVFLRASDCLHLVTALNHNFTEIYTYDAHQAKGAVVLGLKAIKV
jgi:predicted nucleic acid-binding protein